MNRSAYDRFSSDESQQECFACGRPLNRKRPPIEADTRDDQIVYIGPECAKHLTEDGWQPPQGGPKLYPIKRDFIFYRLPDRRVVSVPFDVCRAAATISYGIVKDGNPIVVTAVILKGQK